MGKNTLDRYHSKSDRQRKVFKLFLRDANLHNDPAKIEVREPLEQDILCATFGGKQMVVELPGSAMKRSKSEKETQ